MLVSNKALVNTNNRNYKKFLNFGYDFKIGQTIEVSVEHLEKFSRAEVNCQCDRCGKSIKTKWNLYIRNVNNGYYSCSRKCSMDKFKITCLEKYGTEFPLQNIEVKRQLEQYFFDKYGSHPSKLEYFELKKQKTNLEKYEVHHQMQMKKNVHKIKKTKLEKYGDENYNNHELSKITKLEKYGDENYNNHELSKITKLEKYGNEYYNNLEKFKNNFENKYGVVNPFQLEGIKNKIKEQNLEKYGFEYYQSTEEFKDKFKNTCVERYGVDNIMQFMPIFENQQKSAFKCENYNGIFYRGTYELDFLKFCENNLIRVQKPEAIEYYLKTKIIFILVISIYRILI